MTDAQTILASEQILAYGPRLVPRGQRPPGAGKRFILRVAENDLELATSILAQEAEDDQDQPHCPRCGSWRTVSRKDETECLACHYHGPAAEFLPLAGG